MEENRSAHEARRILIGRIEELAIGPVDAVLSFEARLASENGWALAFAYRVMVEYRRYLVIAATGGEEVTPSDAVDQAWHLHMVYTRSYWHDLCRDTLGRELHHDPTTGGEDRREYYRDRYATTLRLYRDIFGSEPPPDIWPDPSERFRLRFARVDLLRNTVLGYLQVRVAALILGSFAIALLFDLKLVIILMAFWAIAAYSYSSRLKAGTFSTSRSSLTVEAGCSSDSGGCGSGCGGGCGGCG